MPLEGGGPQPRQEQQPAEEAVREMAPSLLRLQLPVDMPGLGHVNTYVMLDDRGATVVDPGLPGPASWGALLSRLDAAGLRVVDVHTVLVTHSHPDHFGGAARLAEEAGAGLVAHGAFRTWWAPGRGLPDPCDVPDVDAEDLPTANPWEQPTPWGGPSPASGWRQRLAESTGEAPGEARDHTGSHTGTGTGSHAPTGAEGLGRPEDWLPPTPDRGVANGQVLGLGGRSWTCLHTPGHTLDHLCLHDPEAGILLSGDHVLPTITPHISGIGSGRDPLAAFLASLDHVAAVPDVALVLPAHGQPFTDLPGRVAEIKAHHEGRLDRLREVSTALGPATVADLSHELFRPARWGPMAESETYAHLEHLRRAGLGERHEERGVAVYLLVPPARTPAPTTPAPVAPTG